MPRRFRGSLRRRLTLALALTLGPTLVLAYLAYEAVRDREQSLRVSYNATAILVKDEVLRELARHESLLAADLKATPAPAGPVGLQSWLQDFGNQRPRLGRLFALRRSGQVVTTDAWAGPSSSTTEIDASESMTIREAEGAEFLRQDLEQALRLYRQAWTEARSDSARALALSREARTLAKLGRLGDSVAVHRRVAATYPTSLSKHGTPYAAIALSEVVDLLRAPGRDGGRESAADDFGRYLLEHPWDTNGGYGYYLRRAQTLALAPELSAAVNRRAERVSFAEWLSEIAAADIERVAQLATAEMAWTRTTALRRGKPVTLLLRSAASTASGDSELVLGLALSADEIAKPLLAQALKSAAVGNETLADFVVESAGAADSLAVAPFGDQLPGWAVAVRDAHGRLIEQLTSRERWAYGGLIAGVFVMLVAGVVFMTKAWARQADLARLQTEFVSNVSHELKTPLALIRMFGETLESGIVADPSRRQEFYGVIRRESERLTHLINNVLDTAKIDAGTKTLTCVSGDIVPLVREALAAYAPLFARINFTVESDLPDGMVMVAMDRDAVAQALVNLFQNVIRYSDENRYVRVSVAGGDREVAVSVADRGVGIPAHELPRIFDKFYRSRSSSDADTSGSGLGLSIVKYVMSAHGGRIDVESTVGRGSVFTLVFPAVRAS